MPKIKIKIDKFKELHSIPSIPGQLLKALDGIEDILAMDYDVVQAIHYDPPIALGILKLANSSLYGHPSEVFSLQQAAGLLGPNAIKNAILTASAFERFVDYQKPDIELEFIDLWCHTAVTASVAEQIGALVDDVESDVCFTAGLIKDCGLIALSMNFPESINDIMQCQAGDKLSLFEAEEVVIGITHAEIGALILEAWGLPRKLSETIKNCCGAEDGNPGSKLNGVIGLAKFLADRWGYGYGISNAINIDINSFLEVINLSRKEFSDS